MKILIIGGSGLIGRALTRELKGSGHAVIITTRSCNDQNKSIITWNPPSLIPADILTDIDAIINLAGESIASGRWTEERKKRILSSRIDTTRALVESVRRLEGKSRVFISSSAIGYYGAHGNEPVTENTPPASDFLADVCRQWEEEALKAEASGVRVVLIRTGGVLEAQGGALRAMAIPFKLFVGGPMGSGKQWFSWIHMDDEVGIIKFALEHDSISGPVNATAPNPVTNREFSTALGKVLGRPSCLAVPGFIVKLTLGELGEVLLTGQRVLPEKVLQAGYRFKYTDVNEALRALYRKK